MPSFNPNRKRKRTDPHNTSRDGELNTSRPTAVFHPSGPRNHTLSVALPGSIIAKYCPPQILHRFFAAAQSHDLRTALAGQIARALSVFCVDEVIVFDDGYTRNPRINARNSKFRRESVPEDPSYTGTSDPNHFLAHLLSFLETPPHLRRQLFGLHANLRTAGSLPSLDLPHHLRGHEWCPYREGATVGESDELFANGSANTPATSSHGASSSSGKGSKKPKKGRAKESQTTNLVDVGFPTPVSLPVEIPLRTRVTVRFSTESAPSSFPSEAPSTATPVAPTAPREEGGYYWGFSVRQAPSLSAVFTESPFPDGYDVSVGTSERGKPLSDVLASADARDGGALAGFEHLLVCFGGVAGLERAVAQDDELGKKGVKEAGSVFDLWVNLCPGQGSRTIRTEEAVWIGLMGLRGIVEQRGRKNRK